MRQNAKHRKWKGKRADDRHADTHQNSYRRGIAIAPTIEGGPNKKGRKDKSGKYKENKKPK